MTLEEAIEKAEKKAENYEEDFRLCPYPSFLSECDGSKDCKCLKNGAGKGCLKCASEYKQLAEWLKELKELRASDDTGRSD